MFGISICVPPRFTPLLLTHPAGFISLWFRHLLHITPPTPPAAATIAGSDCTRPGLQLLLLLCCLAACLDLAEHHVQLPVLPVRPDVIKLAGVSQPAGDMEQQQ